MVWARIPPDKLINLPLFGIDVIGQDETEEHIHWMRGPSGRMAVDVRTPRVWFESVADAHQAGAVAIQIRIAEEEAEAEAFSEQLAQQENMPGTGDDEQQ